MAYGAQHDLFQCPACHKLTWGRSAATRHNNQKHDGKAQPKPYDGGPLPVRVP